MRRRAALALLLTVVNVSACSRPASDLPTTSSSTDASSVGLGISVLDAAPPTASATDGGKTDGIADAYFTALPVHGKSIGHTSVVLKLLLDNGQSAAYKPRSHVGGERFHGEIAAYRLAVALGLDNVPPAIARSFPVQKLSAALDANALDLFSREVITDSDANVRGALIPWISNLAFLPLETAEWRAKWGAWIDGPDMSEFAPPSPTSPGDGCHKALAGQISTMIAFDVMTGNWDRWSGGNIGDGQGGSCVHVLYIDNDGAFFDPVPAAPLADNVALLRKIQLFSRSFVLKLRSTSEADLERALGDELPGKPLLSRHVIDAFFARRKIVLAAIDEKIKTRGEEATLVFQ